VEALLELLGFLFDVADLFPRRLARRIKRRLSASRI